MLSKRLSFPFCAAFIALSLTAVPAFTQTARSRHNTAVDESTDSKATSQSLPPDWDPAVVLDATTDWIGNTWGGNNPSYPNNTLFHVPLDMNNIYVTPDGRVFSNTDWDEGGRAISVFNKNGAMISRLNDQNNSPDWNNAVGNAVASDGHYIFASNGNGSTGLGIFDASNVYNTGLSLTGSSTVYNSQIFGLAIAKGLLYVAENETNQGVPVNLVEVFNISTLALVNTFADISNPVRITADRSGGFWVSHMGPTVPFDYFAQQGLATVDHYDSAGNYVNTITLPDGGEVGALAFNNYSGALLVGDNGPDEISRSTRTWRQIPPSSAPLGRRAESMPDRYQDGPDRCDSAVSQESVPTPRATSMSARVDGAWILAMERAWFCKATPGGAI